MTASFSTTASAADALSLLDLRTNRIDLKLAPGTPGAGDRALALGEMLLAYCADVALTERGARLMAVALLSDDELNAHESAPQDPDAPADVLQTLDEQSDDTPAIGQTGSLFGPTAADASTPANATPAPKRLTPKRLNRMATRRFTQLMAATHGHTPGAARSKRFAGVLDAYVGNGRQIKARAVGLMLLGGETPEEPALAARLEGGNAIALDTPAARQEWLEGLGDWGDSHSYGKHIRANIQLQQLVELALRVHVRQQGVLEGAADDELGLLLGSTMLLRVAREKNLIKGYRIEVSIDSAGLLSVKTPKGAQWIGAVRALADYPDLPLLECQALAPENWRDATRFCRSMDFFNAAFTGASSTRERRLEKWAVKHGQEQAEEKEREHRNAVLTSGLVLKNRAQDMVERCLIEALGEDAVTPRRFQPSEGRRVPVRSGKAEDALPEFLRDGLFGLQVVYGDSLSESVERSELHAALVRALARHGAFGDDPKPPPEQRVSVCQDLAQAKASDHPILVLQVPTSANTRRGASVATSGWVALGEAASKPLTGNATAHALAARDYAGERDISWQADRYTRAKLELYDTNRDGWFALQGLNLSSDDMHKLIDDEEPGELCHKLENISRELKYKYRLQQGKDFPLRGAWQPREEQQAACSGTGARFICLYGHSPRGAPARVAVLEYALHNDVLQVLHWATGTHRLPRQERIGLSAAVVNRTQLRRAYSAALESRPRVWTERLETMLDGMVGTHRWLNDVVMVYSPDDGQMLVEQQLWASAELLGATWRDFPFERVLRDGPEQACGTWLPNRARSNKHGAAAAAQLTPLPGKHDVLLEPEGAIVHGIRAMDNAQAQEKRNNPLISWQVLEHRSGRQALKAADAPHQQPVFHSFIDTLTDNLIKQGSISRTPLPGKLAKLLVRN